MEVDDDETVADNSFYPGPPTEEGGKQKVYVVGVSASVLAERVEYLDASGKLVTESLRDFTKRTLRKHFSSLDDFLNRWQSAERKLAIIEELEAEGVLFDQIVTELGKDFDPFDLICHVAFDAKPLSRRERAENVREARRVQQVWGSGSCRAGRAVEQNMLDEGVISLNDTSLLRIRPFTELGTPVQLINVFGGRNGFVKAVQDLQTAIYQEAA